MHSYEVNYVEAYWKRSLHLLQEKVWETVKLFLITEDGLRKAVYLFEEVAKIS
jgi:hypothetical protein